MAFFGAPFKADTKKGRIEGKGEYTFPNGNVYVGEFLDGQFHGKGTIHFTHGGKYDAYWHHGEALEGKYTFKDGLEYELDRWDYCTKEDRRFFSERVHGFQPGPIQMSNSLDGPKVIPSGTFDVGDGYFDPKDDHIYGYDGVKVRAPEADEKQWVLSYCRKGQ